MRAPIHSVKHIVQYPFSQITTGTREVINLVHSVSLPNVNISVEVAEGAIVKAVFVELWLQNSANDGESIVTLTKDPLNATGPTFVEMASLFSYVNKKNILFTHQGLTTNDGVGNPVRIMGNWFKIPKGKQRFGLGDKLNLNVSNTSANNLNRCGVCIYKEYT